MAYIRQIGEDEATGLVEKIYSAGRGRAGDVANIVKLMSLDGRVMQSSMALYVSLMKSPNALDSARRELLAAVVSNVNDCYY